MKTIPHVAWAACAVLMFITFNGPAPMAAAQTPARAPGDRAALVARGEYITNSASMCVPDARPIGWRRDVRCRRSA